MRHKRFRTLYVLLVCLVFSWGIKAQEKEKDRNLELHVEKVLHGCVTKGHCGDEFTVGMESARASALVLRGWKLRDARVFLGDAPSALREDVQRRMAMTKSIDYLRIDIAVESVKSSQAIVLSQQQFSRLLRLPDGKERRRITSVTHRETWEKSDKGWKLKGFTEQDPTARWEDEKPASPPR
jgi:hypothetical protein